MRVEPRVPAGTRGFTESRRDREGDAAHSGVLEPAGDVPHPLPQDNLTRGGAMDDPVERLRLGYSRTTGASVRSTTTSSPAGSPTSRSLTRIVSRNPSGPDSRNVAEVGRMHAETQRPCHLIRN